MHVLLEFFLHNCCILELLHIFLLEMVPESKNIKDCCFMPEEALMRVGESLVPDKMLINKWLEKNIHDNLFLNEFQPCLLNICDLFLLIRISWWLVVKGVQRPQMPRKSLPFVFYMW